MRVNHNVMLFDGKLRLIDFSQARLASEEAEGPTKRGNEMAANARHVGARLRSQVQNNEPVQWTAWDDLEMAFVSLFGK